MQINKDMMSTNSLSFLDAVLNDNERAMDPRQLSPYATVRFSVCRIASPRLLWLNNGWFLEHGLNVLNYAVRKEIEDYLINQYAVISTQPYGPGSDSNDCENGWLEADRYGGTGGAAHGGSGRCGIRGAYNAKGIGKTPLVSEEVDAGHKNGLMSLKEAVREAISAEICRIELPYGAVPILAIIDTGFTHRLDLTIAEERCAIVVRPNFIRPAHFERSIFFGNAGTPTSSQYIDACRVRQAVQTLGQNTECYPSVREMFTRFARQLGTARALRLWQGRFLSSNLSIDGALIDFGAFRSVPSWRKCIGLAGECFGTEITQLRLAFTSVLYYFARYSETGELDFDFEVFYKELAQIENEAFLDACLEGLGVPRSQFGAQPALQELLLAYYHQQQATTAGDGADGEPCFLYTLLSTPSSTKAVNWVDGEIAKKLISELDRLENAGFPVSRTRTRAFFEPRHQLNYATAVAAAAELERQLVNTVNPELTINQYIEGQYSASIRAWRTIPAEFEVLQLATDIASAALICRNIVNGGMLLHVEGPVLGDHIYLFGLALETKSLKITIDQRNAKRGWFRRTVSSSEAALAILADLGMDLCPRMQPFAGYVTEITEQMA